MKTPEQIAKCIANLAQIAQSEFAAVAQREHITEADWQDFRAEVAALTPAQVGLHAPAGSLARAAALYASGDIWAVWSLARAAQNKRAVEEAWIASTVRVLSRTPKGTLRETRIRSEELHQWIRPGCIVAEHPTRTEDHRSDEEISLGSGRLNYLAYRNGHELDLGTVKDMRIVSGATQYLIRPRSKPAEVRYRAAKARIAKLELEQHDAMMADLVNSAHTIGEEIRKVKQDANIPPRLIALLTLVDYDALHTQEAR